MKQIKFIHLYGPQIKWNTIDTKIFPERKFYRSGKEDIDGYKKTISLP